MCGALSKAKILFFITLFVISGCSTTGRQIQVEGFTGKTREHVVPVSPSSIVYILPGSYTKNELFMQEIRSKITKAIRYKNLLKVSDSLEKSDYVITFDFDIKDPISIRKSYLDYEPGSRTTSKITGDSFKNRGHDYKVESKTSGKFVEREYTKTIVPKLFTMVLIRRSDSSLLWSGTAYSVENENVRNLIDYLIIAVLPCLGKYCSYNYKVEDPGQGWAWKGEKNKKEKDIINYMNSSEIEYKLNKLIDEKI